MARAYHHQTRFLPLRRRRDACRLAALRSAGSGGGQGKMTSSRTRCSALLAAALTSGALAVTAADGAAAELHDVALAALADATATTYNTLGHGDHLLPVLENSDHLTRPSAAWPVADGTYALLRVSGRSCTRNMVRGEVSACWRFECQLVPWSAWGLLSLCCTCTYLCRTRGHRRRVVRLLHDVSATDSPRCTALDLCAQGGDDVDGAIVPRQRTTDGEGR